MSDSNVGPALRDAGGCLVAVAQLIFGVVTTIIFPAAAFASVIVAILYVIGFRT